MYHLIPGRKTAAVLPRPPRAWSPGAVAAVAPPLVLWGGFCAIVTLRGAAETVGTSGVGSILGSFPFVMMVAAILLIVTGRNLHAPRPAYLIPGLAVAFGYVLIWMFNGKRSHSLMGVLTTMCALYLARLKRPSWPVLLTTAFAGSLVVAISIGWRNDRDHPRSLSGFTSFLADFQVSRVLESLNVTDTEDEILTYETEEYGGFLLMMDTVPEKSGYDHGENYLRVFSTFIPRVIWPSKPLFGRWAWIGAWIAGSEVQRDEDFTGPAIGILGATQLNGGAMATAIVLGCIALVLRTAYEYLRLYAGRPLGPVLVDDHLLQRLVHGGQRRPADLVLLQLGVHHVPDRRPDVVAEPLRDACRLERSRDRTRGDDRRHIAAVSRRRSASRR